MFADVQFLFIYYLAFGMDQAYIALAAEPTGRQFIVRCAEKARRIPYL